MSDATLQSLRPPPPKKIKRNRTPGIIFVVVFHVLLVYALVTGLANSAVQFARENLVADVVSEADKDETPPPPPPPDFKPPPPDVVLPEVSIDLATAPPPTTTTTITNAPRVEAPVVAAAPPPPPTPPTPTTSHAVTADDYPPISVRLQEQGVVEIKYLVGADGTVQDVQIVKTSGHDRLDAAAIAMVKRRWKFKPATQDGKPVSQWLPAKVLFQLR